MTKQERLDNDRNRAMARSFAALGDLTTRLQLADIEIDSKDAQDYIQEVLSGVALGEVPSPEYLQMQTWREQSADYALVYDSYCHGRPKCGFLRKDRKGLLRFAMNPPPKPQQQAALFGRV
jgi:hypothetical protein